MAVRSLSSDSDKLQRRLRKIRQRQERKIPPLVRALKDDRPQIRPFDLVLSYSQIKKWRTCRQQWFYAHSENLRPRIKDHRLRQGEEVHELLESLSRDGTWKEKYKEREQIYKKLLPEEQEAYAGLLENARSILRMYERKYTDDGIEYKFIEEKFGPVELSYTGIGRIGLVFVVDGIVEYKNKLWLLERKSHSEFPDPGIRLIDTQTMLYVYGLRQLGWPIYGLIWDEVRTKAPAIPQLLKNGTVSRRKNIDSTWRTYKKTLLTHGQDPDKYEDMRELLKGREKRFLRRQYHPIREQVLKEVVEAAKASAQDLYLNLNRPIMELGYQCRFCDYRNICDARIKGTDVEFIKKQDYTTYAKKDKKKDIIAST